MAKYRDRFIRARTGEIVDLDITVHSLGGKFMKVWQKTLYTERINSLQGNSLRTLWHLVEVAGYNNTVPSPSELSRFIGKSRPLVSRAYSELMKADILIKKDHSYFLNPYFCWKGNNQQYELACRELSESSLKYLA